MKKNHYQQSKQLVQSRLRQMKNAWWERRSEDLQAAADAHDMKTFHQVSVLSTDWHNTS